MQPNEFNGVRRPQTASHHKRASKFSQKVTVSDDASMDSESQSEYSSSSESDEDMQEETKASPNANMERMDTKSPAVHKRGKNKKWNHGRVEVVSTSQPTITPQMKKRSIANLQNRNHGAHGASDLDQFQMKRIELSKGDGKVKPGRKKNLLMTPSQTLVPSRKLLRMKTVGVLNSITTSRVKEEHDVQNLKPSSEFFSQDRMTYVNQLREDFHAMKLWKKSFADAINEIKIDNKEILDRINPKFKRRFVQAPGIKTKTIVFGLDGVLVKTNFEKDHEDWKPTTLILNEDTGAKIKIFVSIRPYVVNTLKQLRRAGAEIILYSTSKYNYTSAILDVLNKQRIEFHHIITADDHEEALWTPENPSRKIVKSNNINLLLQNRKERDVILVDCKVEEYAYKITNGIYVPPYEGPPTAAETQGDDFFMYLFDYLKEFEQEFDVRNKIDKDFKLKELFNQSFKNPALIKTQKHPGAVSEHSRGVQMIDSEAADFIPAERRILHDKEELKKLAQFQPEISMEPISEFPEPAE
eukprot:CAMPEP_0197002040 /NCGR_PEP_ID=MMETSP1380-20130617/6602_1 /TAXON_ID=5936 /ORGANISM="Euplotes crassus, Strain CT5" /LENGTH=525 /DNA_ID=CAMNT_0042419961 /DNA_START=167 /DNA_END=1747 /DNA_ORIENTATION=-